MLSNTSRWLTYVLPVSFPVLGLLLFFLSGQLAPVFAWKVRLASYAPLIFISAATFAYFSLFDFGIKPGQLLRKGTGLRRV
jgi:hypothetical protein